MACIAQGSEPDKSMNYLQIWQLLLELVHPNQLWDIQNFRLPSNSRCAESEPPTMGLTHVHFTNIENEFYPQSREYVPL